MKKILLSVGVFSLALVGSSQSVLNEIYSEPGAGNSEFIELYNNSLGIEQADCFTVLTYWQTNPNNRGWYVIDLPAGVIPSKGWYTLAAASPFSVQGTPGVIASVNYNDAVFRSGATGGYMKKFEVNGGGYSEINITGIDQTDIMTKTSPTGANGPNFYVFLFKNGVMVNAFVGGGASGILPAGITNLPDLSLTQMGVGCGGAFTIDFSALGQVEFHNPAGGSDNGFARTSDGKCGAWTKTSSQVNHTPNATNGGATGLVGQLTTSQLINCNTAPGLSTVSFDITGVSGDATEAADFPVTVQVYYDNGTTIGQLDGADVLANQVVHNTIAQAGSQINIVQNKSVLVAYRTQRGCFDKIVFLANGCAPLPVSISMFKAARQSANVNLVWQTTYELNNLGFYIERNVNGNWETVGFVASQGLNGSSNDLLSYTFVDLNNVKGITQYRLRQQDIDGKTKYSEIRSVRGEGQPVKLTAYPNPSMDGKVNIVFDDANAVRNIAVLDMSGRVVRQINGVTNNNITIENLQPGVYTVRVIVPETGAQGVEKIIVNKR